MPDRLPVLAEISLLLAGVCALLITADIVFGRRQRMGIMNLVWPLTALYAGPLGLWAYLAVGRARESRGEAPATPRPFWQSVGLAASHCGSGCTLGDLVAEGVLLPLVPLTLFGHRIFAAWAVDYVVAFLIGIAFQYYTIVPMKHLSPRQGIAAALKADTLSLTAWQVGMYGWMAVATFLVFGTELDKRDPVFWFMMQLAMLAGFLTSYPVNWWLVRTGIKERM